jgi:amidase
MPHHSFPLRRRDPETYLCKMQKAPYSLSRREFIAAAGAGVFWSAEQARAVFPRSTDPNTDLLFMSATKLAQSIREKRFSALEAVRAHLAQIERVNPRLNAVVQLCAERALAEARQLDALLARGTVKGPLHGVPMTIKDSFDTAGVVTTGGTLGRKDFVPGRDATVIARLREAGAVLMGKTNTPEFTMSFKTNNLVYGVTRNPYDLNRQPGGSSGGAAAIVASGGSSFEIGSDFGGSIRYPAHACGIAGIKPTTGRVPRTGHIVDYGGYFDAYQQIGPLARRVEDLVTILPIIAGPDDIDAAIVPMPLEDPASVNLRGLRVAFYTNNGIDQCQPAIQEVVRTCAGMLRSQGATVTEVSPPMMKEIHDIRPKLVAADGREWLKRLVRKSGTRQTSAELVLDATPIAASEFTRLAEQFDEYRTALLTFVENYDIILCPPSHTVAPPVDDPPGLNSYTITYNLTGWPGAVVRAGATAEGLPIGIQIVGRPWTEHVVLAVAAHVESQTGGWKKPPIAETQGGSR